MMKNSLAIILIGSLVTCSSFATPLHVKNMFMKDQIMKSSMVSKNHTQSSQSRFSGTWAGTCTHDGESDEVKIRIVEDEFDFSIIDLINEGENETVSFNVLESKTRTDKDFYESSTSRLTRINENTIKFEGTEVFATPSNTEEMLASGVFTSTAIVNNNQLTIDTVMKLSNENNKESVDKCILKRTG